MTIEIRRHNGCAVIALGLLLLAAPLPLLADEFATVETPTGDCLDEAGRILKPGETVTIELVDGRRITERLVALDPAGRTVITAHWDELGAAERRTPADQVVRYVYGELTGDGAAKSAAVIGSVIGAVAGMSAMRDKDDFYPGLEGALGGAVLGGGLGYAVGSSMNTGQRPAGVIECGPPAPPAAGGR